MYLQNRFNVFGVVVSLVAGLSSLWAAAGDLPRPEIETLPNGLQVVWFLKDSLPVIDLSLVVRAGHRDDPSGKSGTSELLAATLDRGAGGLTAKAIAHAVESLGASRYITAEDDSVTLGVHGLAPDASELLDILAKVSLQPEFSPTEVKREHARIMERWSHMGDYGEALAALAFNRIMASDTSYGRGSLLSMAEFKSVGRNDVLDFHKKFFTPKNCMLLVVGRADKDEFKKKIIAHFGTWQGEGPQHERKNYKDSRLFGKGRHRGKTFDQFVIVDRPDLTQAQVRIGMRAPLILNPAHYALMVGNALLGDYFNSRLNTLLRDKLGLTYSIQSNLIFKKEYAEWTISSATRNETVGQLIQKTADILRNLKKGPVLQAEVDTAKTYLQGGFPLSTATLQAVASRWLSANFLGLKDDYLNEFTKKIEAVQLQDVQNAITQFVDTDHLVVVVAGDAKKITKSLSELELDVPRKVTLQDLQ